MPYAEVNGVELYYETDGDPTGPPLLLIAGLGVQMIDWADHVITPLVEAGHWVIRYDNRDIGLSTTFDDAPSDPRVVLSDMLAGDNVDVAYTLTDMAADAVGLLDVLGLASAHFVGVSMGGMIAQVAAISYSDRVTSLTSIMSTTGAGDVGQPSAAALEAILTPAPSGDRDQRIAQGVSAAKIWASPDHYDVDRLEKLFQNSWDRVGGPQAENTGRHICAIVASKPREALLTELSVPTLVVHGDADQLITTTGGQRTAALVPGADFLLVEGMGHDLPPAFAPRIVKAISDLVAGVEAA